MVTLYFWSQYFSSWQTRGFANPADAFTFIRKNLIFEGRRWKVVRQKDNKVLAQKEDPLISGSGRT